MTQTIGADASEEREGPEPLLAARGISKRFITGGYLARAAGRQRVLHAVEDVSVSIGRAETLGIVGESGCGKTTLGRTLVRLYEPSAGRLVFDGHDITSSREHELRVLRRRFQMIFQHPRASLNPTQTVGEILSRTLRVHGVRGRQGQEVQGECLRLAGLDPVRFARRYPRELSGGEAQRVGIARALLLRPELIVADEPVSSLDVTIQAQIIRLLEQLRSREKLSLVFISHDMAVVKYISHRVLVMYLGRVVEESPTRDLFAAPHHPYTKALLEAVPQVGRRQLPVGLSGQVPSPTSPPSGCPFHGRCPVKIGDVCETQRPSLTEVSSGHKVACHLYGGDQRPTA